MQLLRYYVIGLRICNVFDINYHPSTARINVQGCVVLTHSYGELNCDRLHTYYNYFHLYHYSLLTSIHKPVLARAPSSVTNIRYADDTIMLAESEQQLQHMIDKLDATCEQVEKTPEKQCEVNVK